MISSMTGFGKASGTFNKSDYTIEIRTVNSRFFEMSFKYPKFISARDFDLKDIVRQRISRGKISVFINVSEGDAGRMKLNYSSDSVKEILKILKSIRKDSGSKEKIKIEHILRFSDFLTEEIEFELDEVEFTFITGLLNKAIDDLMTMKKREGEYLKKDMLSRVDFIEKEINIIEDIGKQNSINEKEILKSKVEALLEDKTVIDEKRLEMELTFLADKLDITEECTRLRSHIIYFRDCIDTDNNSGRRINFLLQEINREINTIASKSMNAVISQKVSMLKEELERIREQVQNVE